MGNCINFNFLSFFKKKSKHQEEEYISYSTHRSNLYKADISEKLERKRPPPLALPKPRTSERFFRKF